MSSLPSRRDLAACQVDAFRAAIEDFAAEFGIAPQEADGGTPRQRGPRLDRPDPIADYLDEHGYVVGEGRHGELYVECPWTDEHTTNSGPSATAWFRAGTKGYERGAFRCLHAHCANRRANEFREAIGY